MHQRPLYCRCRRDLRVDSVLFRSCLGEGAGRQMGHGVAIHLPLNTMSRASWGSRIALPPTSVTLRIGSAIPIPVPEDLLIADTDVTDTDGDV